MRRLIFRVGSRSEPATEWVCPGKCFWNMDHLGDQAPEPGTLHFPGQDHNQTGKPCPPLATSSSLGALLDMAGKENGVLGRADEWVWVWETSTGHRGKARVVSVLSPGMEVSRRVYHSHHNNPDKERARKECGSSLRTERTWESSKRDKVIRIYMKSANSLSAFPVPTI